MAFEKKTWTDRVAEFINRRTLTKSDGTTEIVTVARNEGTISQEGDAFNAANMNNLEKRIDDEFTRLNNNLLKIDSTFSIEHIVANKLDYIKNGKERILTFNGCTLNNLNSVDISDSYPTTIIRELVQSQYNSGLVNAMLWYDSENKKFAGNYRPSYGSTSPTVLSGTSVLYGSIRWYVD